MVDIDLSGGYLVDILNEWMATPHSTMVPRIPQLSYRGEGFSLIDWILIANSTEVHITQVMLQKAPKSLMPCFHCGPLECIQFIIKIYKKHTVQDTTVQYNTNHKQYHEQYRNGAISWSYCDLSCRQVLFYGGLECIAWCLVLGRSSFCLVECIPFIPRIWGIRDQWSSIWVSNFGEII